MAQEGVPSLEAWLKANMPEGSVLGIDPNVHSIDEAEKLQKAVASVEGATMQPLTENLVDIVWAHPDVTPARPALPSGAARVLPLEVAGVSAADKLAAVRAKTLEAGATAYLGVALDEVAWLLNLRGEDVPCCPLLQARGPSPPPAAAAAPPPSHYPPPPPPPLAPPSAGVRAGGGGGRHPLCRRSQARSRGSRGPPRLRRGAGGKAPPALLEGAAPRARLVAPSA